MRPFLTTTAIAVSLAAGYGTAYAYAHLRSAAPAADSVVAAAPPELAIIFTQGVEPQFSSIEVQDAAGHRVDKNDPHTATGNNTVLLVGLMALPAGTYTVVWHATSVDTHKTEGTFKFTVKP